MMKYFILMKPRKIHLILYGDIPIPEQIYLQLFPPEQKLKITINMEAFIGEKLGGRAPVRLELHYLHNQLR